MIEHRFGESPVWSVGVEEELMVLDAGTLALAPSGAALIEAVRALRLPGEVKPELFASVIELATGVCAGPREALEQLVAMRRAVAAAAAPAGLAFAAAGSHPFSVPEDQEIAPDERYLDFVRYAGVSARRQGVQGLHVHVGMPDRETCWRALEGVLPWLPLVLALSANSPYLAGQETGLASNRAEILAQLPRSSAPPPFSTYAEWEAFVERLVWLRLAKDYTNAWWDVRPAPKFGTLEVRMPDQPTNPARSGALIALVQALCVAVLRERPAPGGPESRGIYQHNRWAALRHGGGAELVHPDRSRVVSVPELLGELVERVEPVARELGTLELLTALGGPGAEGERQLELGRESGLAAVCADLVERSLPSP